MTLARNGRWIYIEIKSGPEIVPYVKKIFAKQKNATPKNTLFICFNKSVCKALDQQMPEYKTFWLTGARTQSQICTTEEIIKSLKKTGATGVDINFDITATDANIVKAIHDAGFEAHCWTVDDLTTSLLAFKRGIQTETTNCAKKQLDDYQRKRK